MGRPGERRRVLRTNGARRGGVARARAARPLPVEQRAGPERADQVAPGQDLDFAAAAGVGVTAHDELAPQGGDRAESVEVGAIALGIEAAQRRHRVRFFRADELVRALTEAKSQHEVGRLTKRLDGVDVLIVDELGFVPFDRTGAELLFNLLATRYQRRATVVTTNLAFSEWTKVFGDEKLTAALLDRIAENAHVVLTGGSSYRTRRPDLGTVGPP